MSILHRMRIISRIFIDTICCPSPFFCYLSSALLVCLSLLSFSHRLPRAACAVLKESPSCSTTAFNPSLSPSPNSYPSKGRTKIAIKGEKGSDLTTSLSTEEGKAPSPVLVESHRSFGEDSIAHHGEFERILGAGCVCEENTVGEGQLSHRTSVRHLGSRGTDVGGVQQPETGSYVSENGVGSPVSTCGDKNIYHELIAELQDVEIPFGDTETAHNERRGVTAGTYL
jgi:hypothetical protein